MKRIVFFMFLVLSLNMYAQNKTKDQSAEKGNDYDVQYAKAMKYVDKGKYKKAVPILTMLSDANYVKASHQLGLIYMNGSLNGETDYENACKEFKKVVRNKYPKSNKLEGEQIYYQDDTDISITLMFPPGGSRQQTIIETKYDASCGGKLAMYQYAAIMETSVALRNAGEIERFYRQSANHGFMPGAYHLGVLYEKGDILTKNMNEAAKWYEKVSDFCINGPKPVKLATVEGEEISSNSRRGMEEDAKSESHVFSYQLAVGDIFSANMKVAKIDDESITLLVSPPFTANRERPEMHTIKIGSSERFYDRLILDAKREYIYELKDIKTY